MKSLQEHIYESIATGAKKKGKYLELKYNDNLLTWAATLKSAGLKVEKHEWFEEIQPGIVNYVLNGDGSTELHFQLDGDLFKVHFSKGGKLGDIYTAEAGIKRWVRCFVEFVNARLQSINESVGTGKRSKYGSKLETTADKFENMVETWGVGVKRAPQSRVLIDMVSDARKTSKVVWRPDQSGLNFYIVPPQGLIYEIQFSDFGKWHVSRISTFDPDKKQSWPITSLSYGTNTTQAMEEEFNNILEILGIL